MRKKVVRSNQKIEAYIKCPWAKHVLKGDHGWHCFESREDAEEFTRKRLAKRSIKYIKEQPVRGLFDFPKPKNPVKRLVPFYGEV